jgi:uncharacterized membrane protein YadS
MQSAIVIVIVALAILYLVWRKLGSPKGAPPTCGCGCSGCGAASVCGDTPPHVLRPNAGADKEN